MLRMAAFAWFLSDNPGARPEAGLIVHEWGTFTSVAGAEGRGFYWTTLAKGSELPCFVHRLTVGNTKLAMAQVRMETPVLYFYAKNATTASVHVDFPQGLISEWYPQASAVRPKPTMGNSGGHIDWDSVEVLPGGGPGDVAGALPNERAANHYYAARHTDSAPIRVGQEREKMIFYRGLGNFDVPVRAQAMADGTIEAANVGGDPIGTAIVFENRAGVVRYSVTRNLKDSVRLYAGENPGAGRPGGVAHEMEGALADAGLYPKEAKAMIETWSDSWFEEGARIFYIVPRAQVDAILPLTIAPVPTEIQRVFVGRVEVLTPWMEDSIQDALATGDVPALEKFGRFLQPFLGEMRKTRGDLVQSPAAANYLDSAYRRIDAQLTSASCEQ